MHTCVFVIQILGKFSLSCFGCSSNGARSDTIHLHRKYVYQFYLSQPLTILQVSRILQNNWGITREQEARSLNEGVEKKWRKQFTKSKVQKKEMKFQTKKGKRVKIQRKLIYTKHSHHSQHTPVHHMIQPIFLCQDNQNNVRIIVYWSTSPEFWFAECANSKKLGSEKGKWSKPWE
jgi:hypothetical protein